MAIEDDDGDDGGDEADDLEEGEDHGREDFADDEVAGGDGGENHFANAVFFFFDDDHGEAVAEDDNHEVENNTDENGDEGFAEEVGGLVGGLVETDAFKSEIAGDEGEVGRGEVFDGDGLDEIGDEIAFAGGKERFSSGDATGDDAGGGVLGEVGGNKVENLNGVLGEGGEGGGFVGEELDGGGVWR